MAPVPVIDNIGSAAFPDATNDRGINNANWLVHSFKTPVASSAYLLKSLRLALANTDGAPARPLVISLYNSSDSGSAINGSPTVNITGGFRPVNQPLATTSVSPLLNISGNSGATGVNSYTLLDDSIELGSLFDYVLMPNTEYSLVFSASNNLSVRSMAQSYSESAGFDFLNNTGTFSGTALTPNITVDAWQSSSQANLSTFGLTIGAVEVPGPLPVLGAAAAFGYSRRLRRRIQQQP
jgi:hypothetical protein